MRPRLLVLDEPTEGIQPSIIKDIGRVIRLLRERGEWRSCWSSSTTTSPARWPTSSAVMDRGEIVLAGRPRSWTRRRCGGGFRFEAYSAACLTACRVRMRRIRRASASRMRNSSPLGWLITSPARGHPAGEREHQPAHRVDIGRALVLRQHRAHPALERLDRQARVQVERAVGTLGDHRARRLRRARRRCRPRCLPRDPRWSAGRRCRRTRRPQARDACAPGASAAAGRAPGFAAQPSAGGAGWLRAGTASGRPT